MGVGILGLGYYSPERVVKNSDLEAVSKATDEWIVSRVGIRERRVCSEDEAASDLAYKASLEALADAGVEPAAIDLIIVACSNHDMIMPSTACIVQAKLGATNAAALDIRAGCAGFIYGLSVAEKFVKDGTTKLSLVIGAEVHSKMMDWRDYRTNAFFSDGAGAAVVGVVPDGFGILGTFLAAEGHLGDALVVPAGGSRMPASHETVAAGLHYIRHDGKAIWAFATRVFPHSVRRAAERASIQISDIDFVIPHQANINMIRQCMAGLGLPMEKTHITLDRFGNSASGTVPITLAEAVRLGKIKRGDTIAMTAFGAGLTYGAIILKWY